MSIKAVLAGLSSSLLLSVSMTPLMAVAAPSTVVVTPLNTQGWAFSRDQGFDTPYEFNQDQASEGIGSLYVKPITNTLNPGGDDKFIAEKSIGLPVSEINSISYDFLIAGNGDPSDANQFYLNVYTSLPVNPNSFYDCRFDYVPTVGSTAAFTTASFSSSAVPTFVASRGGALCPTTLSGMPAGSTVKFISLNVGDRSTNDTGLAGYLDNVVVATASGSTSYDFEPFQNATSKEQCKNDGYKLLSNATGQSFKNQGDCVSFVASGGKNQASGSTSNPLAF